MCAHARLHAKTHIFYRFNKIVSACCLDKDFETFGAGDRVEVSCATVIFSTASWT